MARPLADTATIVPFLRGNSLSVRWSFRGLKYRTPALAKGVGAHQIAKNGYVKNNHDEHLTINTDIAAAVDRLGQATKILLNGGDVTEQRINQEYTRLTKEAVAAVATELRVEDQQAMQRRVLLKGHRAVTLPDLEAEIEALEAQLVAKKKQRDNLKKSLGMYDDDSFVRFLELFGVRKGITTMEASTSRSHASFIETLKRFDADVKIQDIDDNWILAFQDWLIVTPSVKPIYSSFKDGKRQKGDLLYYKTGNTLKNNSIETYIVKVQSCLKYYQSRPELLPAGCVINDNWKRYESDLMGKNDNVVALEENELLDLFHFRDFKMQEQERAIDILLFLCATSLRKSDLKKVIPSSIKNGKINLIAQKTKKYSIKVSIPLNPISTAILKKYGNDMNKCKMATQRINQRIREVLNHNAGKTFPTLQIMEKVTNYSGKEDVGTEQTRASLIGNHSGRRTFINICLDYNVPVNKIIGMTGHTDVNTLMIYANKRKDVQKHMVNMFQLSAYEEQDYTAPLLLAAPEEAE